MKKRDIDYTACVIAMCKSGFYSGNYSCMKFEREFRDIKKRLEKEAEK